MANSESTTTIEELLRQCDAGTSVEELLRQCDAGIKPRILLAACGSVAAATKFGNVVDAFTEWAEVKVVITKTSLKIMSNEKTVPILSNVAIFCDNRDQNNFKSISDSALHIELRDWADVLVIAPLSAHTLAKIAGGLCDNLLTSIIRAWDYKKPMFVAPSMSDSMWRNPFTEQHLMSIEELGISFILPIQNMSNDMREMADPSTISLTVKNSCISNILKDNKAPGEV